MLQSVAIEKPFGRLIIQFLPIVSEDVHKEKNEILNIREYLWMTQGQSVT